MNHKDLIPEFNYQIEKWLQEDVPSFDIGGFVVGSESKTGKLYAKSPGILAGSPFFIKIFTHLGCEAKFSVEEGEMLEASANKVIATVFGPSNQILLGERLSLNLISRVSGVATKSNRIVSLAKSKGWNGKIAGTRKTTPGFRLYEKYGLIIGGADTHRMDLSSLVMIKDNHIHSLGSIDKAVKTAKSISSIWTKIEVEVTSYHQALEAIKAGSDILLLDNFNPDDVKATAQKIKKDYPNILIEVSGGISEENITKFFDKNIDVISLGTLTNFYEPIDFSLKIH